MMTGRAGPRLLLLDTNVVVAALLWNGMPRQLLERIVTETSLGVLSSPRLVAELARVLRRPRFEKRRRATGMSADELVARYAMLATIVQPQNVMRVVAADTDDDHVLAAAVCAGASLIVTGDRSHLLPIGQHQGIAIVTPRAAWVMLTLRVRPADSQPQRHAQGTPCPCSFRLANNVWCGASRVADLDRFSQYWNKVLKSAMQHSAATLP